MVMPLNNFLGDGFSLVDGGNNATNGDVLQVGSPTGPGMLFNFETSNNVFNIEKLTITSANAGSNVVQLNLQDVFDMTDSAHSLTIGNATLGYLSNLIVDTAGWNIGATPLGPIAAGSSNVTINATFGTESVTLIINTGASPGDGVNVTIQ